MFFFKSFIFQAKRMRILSDSESNSSFGPQNGFASPTSGLPSPDVIQQRLDLMQKSYPNKDRMELQDALKSSDWNVAGAMSKLRSEMKLINGPSISQKFANLPKKHRVKAHEAVEYSDSEEEEEYADNKKVFDSDSDAEEEEINENALPEDKKRVLNFFNNGTIQELAAIQGKLPLEKIEHPA